MCTYNTISSNIFCLIAVNLLCLYFMVPLGWFVACDQCRGQTAEKLRTPKGDYSIKQ